MFYPAAYFHLFTKTMIDTAYHRLKSFCLFPAFTHNDDFRTVLDSGCHNLHHILRIDTFALVFESDLTWKAGCHPDKHTRGTGMKAGKIPDSNFT